MPVNICIDFETRSRLDLGETSTYKYAQHSSTEVRCMSWSVDNEPVKLWKPDQPFPFDSWWTDACFCAFNAEFELAVWNHCCVCKYGWPAIRPDQMSCLQARAAYMGLPRRLDRVCDAVGLGEQGKDKEGHAAMLKLCRPTKGKLIGCEFVGGAFLEASKLDAANEAYCAQDTRVEKLVGRLAPPLPPLEAEVWLAHQSINERGVPVDLAMVRNAVWMIEQEYTRINAAISELTGGAITTPNQLDRIKLFLKQQGCPLPNLQENTLNDALAGIGPPLTPEAWELLEARKLCRDAAASKYQAILNHAGDDGYVRNSHVFYKAGPGRFAGQGVQFQNLRRLVNEEETESFVQLANRIEVASDARDIYAELLATKRGVIPTLAAMVRMAVCAHTNKKLVVSDYTAIEMRVLHWMAGDHRALKAIRDFDAGVGEEPYKLAAASIYSKPVSEVTKAERNVGKVQILGCGYLQGAEKFANFAKNYNIDLPLDKAHEIVQLYRRSNPAVKQFWYRTGDAAVKAVTHEGRTHSGPVEFYMTGCTLNARLPSGREIKYYDPSVVDGLYGPEIVCLDQRSGNRRTIGLPVLIENLDQAISRDLLADALIKSYQENLPVVLHVHDEIVIETPADNTAAAATLGDIMRDAPAWAKGCPIACKVDESRRYVK